MDAVGLAASLLALVQGAAFLLEYVKDVKDGPRDRAELRLSLAALPGLLTSLKDQFDNTALNSPWAAATANLAIPDGPFAQLIALLQRIQSKTNIPASRTGQLWQKLKWTIDKADVAELLLKVERVKSLIMLALQNNHVALSREIQKDVQVLHQQMENVSKDVREVSSGISAVSMKVEDVAKQIFQRIEPMATGVKHLQGRGFNADLRGFAEWLSPLNFQAVQDNFFSKSASGTGEWFIKHSKFQQWISGQAPLLWCPGKPGVGKTILASKGVHHLQKSVKKPGVGVAYVFFDYNHSNSQTTATMIGSVLRQLLIDFPSIPEPLRLLHAAFTSDRERPSSLSDLRGALEAQLQLYSHVYLVVDALDECSEDRRDEFVAEIRSLTNTSRLRVLITSRDIAAIGQQFTNDSRIDLLAYDEDVHSYIVQRIWKDKRLKILLDGEKSLEHKIVEDVTKKADGMFLLVRLHMDTLTSKNNRKALRDALSTLPKEIYRSYDDAMGRIDSQGPDDSQLARKIFMWLAYGQGRELSTRDIQYALAISPGMVEMDLDAITSVEILSTICAGLVVVEECFPFGFKFVHYTAQEYFKLETSQKHFRLNEITEYLNIPMDVTFPFAHFSIATTCLTYLTFEDPNLSNLAYIEPPLLDYALKYWGDHTQRCEHMLCTIPKTRDLLLKLIESESRFTNTFYKAFQYSRWGYRHTYRFPHLLSRFGLIEVITLSLERGAGIDCLDGKGRTPLMHAVKYNHLPMVEFLIGRGAHVPAGCSMFDPNYTTPEGKTLLHYAAAGHSQARSVSYFAITKFLLGLPGIKPDVKSTSLRYGCTVLQCVAHSENSDALDLLYSEEVSDVDVYYDTPPTTLSYAATLGGGRTPLSCAAQAGNADIVDLLIQSNDVDPDSIDEFGHTPLSHAASQGHLDVVNILLHIRTPNMNGCVDVNSKDHHGMTPLSLAAEGGHFNVLKLLLQHPHIHSGIADIWGRTPLLWAARRGEELSFQLLLARNEVTLDSVDENDTGLLAHAAYGHNINIVRHILDQLHLSADVKDRHFRTPLSYAAENGCLHIAELLLQRDDVDINSVDSTSQTSLSYAARNGHKDVVEVMLRRNDLNINSKDSRQQTPIMHAVRLGSGLFSKEEDRPDVVKLFLQRDDINVNAADADSRTVLSHAAERGLHGAVKLLLQRDEVDPDSLDSNSRTPLSYAAACYRTGNEGVVELLLQQDAVEPDRPDLTLRTPLSYAAASGNDGVVELLLQRDAVEPDRPDLTLRTPLSYAAQQCFRGYNIVRILLQREEVDPNSLDTHLRTPLSYAAQNECWMGYREMHMHQYEIVELLLAHPKLQPNLADRAGMTPLMYSTSSGCPHVSNLLLNRPETDPHLTSKNGRTLLIFAASRGNTDLMRRLLDEYQLEADAKDKSSRTALSYAAEFGRTAAVKLLLARRDVDINSRDRHSQTPLYHALIAADEETIFHREVAHLLRQHGAIADGPDLLIRLESEECTEMWQWL